MNVSTRFITAGLAESSDVRLAWDLAVRGRPGAIGTGRRCANQFVGRTVPTYQTLFRHGSGLSNNQQRFDLVERSPCEGTSGRVLRLLICL